MELLNCDYKVVLIDGDYAHLQRTDMPDGAETRGTCFLPYDIIEECTLHYEMMEYSMK